jgi:phage terminase large subunit
MYCRDLVIMADGPTGSGKTRPALEKAYFCASHWPGTRVLLLRKAKAHAATTIMTTWETQVCPEGDPAAKLQARNYKSPAYCFPNGSVVAVDGMYDGSGYNQAVMGTEWDIIIPDEGTQYSEDDAMRLIGRLNRIAPTPERIPFNQIIFPCNPDAPRHWLWQWHLTGKLTRIPSRLEDNPVFYDGTNWTLQGLKYLATVDKYTGVMRERNRFGRWVGAEGMIYDEWDEKMHIVDRLPPGSEDWWRVRSIDFGYREPFVCLWGVVDPNGRIYIEREYVRCNKTVSRHAPELKRLTPDEGLVQFTVADHDAEDRATLAENDIDTVPALKPRKDTDWAAHFDWVKRRLQPAADGFPRLFVVRDAVKGGGGREPLLGNKPCGIIEEITGYQWEEPKPDKASRERPAQVNDHSMDALRYLCLAVDRWFDGEAERDKPDYEDGTIGEALGLNEEDDD